MKASGGFGADALELERSSGRASGPETTASESSANAKREQRSPDRTPDVRNRNSTGAPAEARAARGVGSTILVDTGRQKKLRLASWIVDWNFPDRNGKTVRWPATLPERLQVVYSLGEKVGAWLEQQIVRISGNADAVVAADAEDESSGPLLLSSGDRKPGRTSP